MKKLIVFAAMAIAGGGASAAGTGTLTVTGSIVGSLAMQITPAFGTVSGAGTDTATAALGDISKYGPVPTGFTRTIGATTYTLSSTVSVRVDQANAGSPDFNLLANLGTGPGFNQWKLDGTALTTSAFNLRPMSQYATPHTLNFDLIVPNGSGAGPIDNTINFTASAN